MQTEDEMHKYMKSDKTGCALKIFETEGGNNFPAVYFRFNSMNNKLIIAAAGSGKTTRLVEEALKNKDKRFLSQHIHKLMRPK